MYDSNLGVLSKNLLPTSIPLRAYFSRFLIYSTAIIIVFTLMGVAAFQIQSELEVKEELVNNRSAIVLAASLAKHDFETVIADLFFLANDNTTLDFLKGENSKNNIAKIQQEFLNLSRTRKLYDQVRLINPSGDELVRINIVNGKATIVSSDKLQNKLNRYYFSKTTKLAKGEFYISPIDLNVENGKVEFPHKPMIRFGTPLYDTSGVLRGAIILNFLGQIFLDQFKHQMELAPGTGMLINSDGYWLSSPNPEDEWAFMFGGDANFGKQYPNAWKTMIKKQVGMVETSLGSFSYSTVYPLTRTNQTPIQGKQLEEWKIISVSSVEQISFSLIKTRLIRHFPFLVILPMALFIGWYSARASTGRKLAEQKLALANLSLEEKVKSRTHDLGKRVKEQTGLYSISVILRRLNITIEKAFELVVEIIPSAWHYPGFTCARITYNGLNFTTNKFKKTGWRQSTGITLYGKQVGEIEVYYLEEMPELDEGPFMKEERSLINSIATSLENFIIRKHTEQSLHFALNEAEIANNTKSEFLASMSHELRTPLNAVLGFAQMLQFDPNNKLSQAQNTHVENILDGGNHLLKLVNSILDLAKIEANQISLVIKNLPASDIVIDCIKLTIPLGKPKCIEIVDHFSSEVSSILRTDGVIPPLLGAFESRIV